MGAPYLRYCPGEEREEEEEGKHNICVTIGAAEIMSDGRTGANKQSYCFLSLLSGGKYSFHRVLLTCWRFGERKPHSAE